MNIATQTGSPEPEKKAASKKKSNPKKKSPQKAKPNPKVGASQANGEQINNEAASRKNENKNIRKEIGEEKAANQMSESDQVRAATGKQAHIDWGHYVNLPEYEGMRLFGCHDEPGELDNWIRLGAEPVRRRARAAKIFKGLNDGAISEYEYAEVDTDKAGNRIRCYLMFMDEARYHELRIQPLIDRNNAMRQSMGMGQLNNDGVAIMPNVKGLQTYAAKTDVNGVATGNGMPGLSTELTHDV